MTTVAMAYSEAVTAMKEAGNYIDLGVTEAKGPKHKHQC